MKRTTIFFSLVAAILIGVALFGCGTFTALFAPEVSMCDSIPEDSYSVICEASHYLGTEPEALASVLKISNLGGLARKKYTAQEASAFVGDIRQFLERARSGPGIVYAALIEFAEGKYIDLPQEVQVSIEIAMGFANIDFGTIPGMTRELSEFDYQRLFKHLDDQDAIIAPFLACRASPMHVGHC